MIIDIPIIIFVFILITIYNLATRKEQYATSFSRTAYFEKNIHIAPIVRIYSFSVNDLNWQDMENFSRTKPVDPEGITIVYFFRDGAYAPKTLSDREPNFNPDYQEYCVGRFTAKAGEKIFEKYPFNGGELKLEKAKF